MKTLTSRKKAPRKPKAARPKTMPLKLKRLQETDMDKLAAFLNALVAQYKVPGYIQNDPIQIPWRYDHPADRELVAFITAMFSYGRRDVIIETISRLVKILGPRPVEFVGNFEARRDARLFKHFVYRFNKGPDVVFLLERLRWALETHGSLEALMRASFAPETRPDLRAATANFLNALLGETPLDSYGVKFLFAHPDRGGACKRFNMFLRWVVREDADPAGRVDFGLWKNSLRPADLLIPLDTHVLKMNQALGLTERTDGSWQTAQEVTAFFRRFAPDDPVRYDYALFGFSLDRRLVDEFAAAIG